jgi:hypothetical protein
MALDPIELPSIRCGNCGYIIPMNYNHLHYEVECENCHSMIKLDNKSATFYKKQISSKMNTKYSSERERNKIKYPSVGTMFVIIMVVALVSVFLVAVSEYNGANAAYERGEDYNSILAGHISYETMKNAKIQFEQEMELDRPNQHTHKTY